MNYNDVTALRQTINALLDEQDVRQQIEGLEHKADLWRIAAYEVVSTLLSDKGLDLFAVRYGELRAEKWKTIDSWKLQLKRGSILTRPDAPSMYQTLAVIGEIRKREDVLKPRVKGDEERDNVGTLLGMGNQLCYTIPFDTFDKYLQSQGVDPYCWTAREAYRKESGKFERGQELKDSLCQKIEPHVTSYLQSHRMGLTRRGLGINWIGSVVVELEDLEGVPKSWSLSEGDWSSEQVRSLHGKLETRVIHGEQLPRLEKVILGEYLKERGYDPTLLIQ